MFLSSVHTLLLQKVTVSLSLSLVILTPLLVINNYKSKENSLVVTITFENKSKARVRCQLRSSSFLYHERSCTCYTDSINATLHFLLHFNPNELDSSIPRELDSSNSTYLDSYQFYPKRTR